MLVDIAPHQEIWQIEDGYILRVYLRAPFSLDPHDLCNPCHDLIRGREKASLYVLQEADFFACMLQGI